MAESDLLKIYLAVLRPVLDYASPTYNSLLTKQQDMLLESLQKRAAKIIFGIGSSYTSVISDGGMQPLHERRESLCLSFAQKAATSEKFGKVWFPKNPESIYNIRNPEIYKEVRAKTERMKKNPLCYMRSKLNRLR